MLFLFLDITTHAREIAMFKKPQAVWFFLEEEIEFEREAFWWMSQRSEQCHRLLTIIFRTTTLSMQEQLKIDDSYHFMYLFTFYMKK